jgi:hypothetical protein
VEQLANRMDSIAEHLNALDEKIDAIFQMVKASMKE